MTALEKLIELGKRKEKLWRAHCDKLRAELARLDPRTGGNPGLVHNWGNEAARDALARGAKRWRKFADRADAIGNALARAHVKGL